MSKRINTLLVSIVILWVFTGCETANIPRYYLPSPKDVKKSITGSWIEVTLNLAPGEVQQPNFSGELIAVQSDTLYILSEVQLSALKINNIGTAILYIFKNQGGKYALFTGLLLSPNIIGTIANGSEFGQYFLALGIPIALTGFIIAIIENSSKTNRLIYPERNSIEEFKKFARFPMGIPPGLNKNELHLLKQTGN